MSQNSGRLLFLLALIVVLTAVILSRNFLSQLFIDQNREQPFKKIDKQNITAIVITSDTKITNLYKKGSLWMLQNNGIEFQADQGRINIIVDSVINVTKGEVVSNNKNNHEVFGIGKKKIVLKSRTDSITLYVGSVSGITNNYVRIDDANEVLIVSGFNDMFSPDDYRDLAVHFVENEDNVTQVTIAFNNQVQDFNKKDGQWFSQDIKLKKERMDFFLNDLKTLKASDIFLTEPFENSYPQESLKITVIEKGKNKTATFYVKGNAFILKTSVFETFFQIPDVYVSSLKKQQKDFVE